jgi:environmental stress-induced protein Ves
MRASSPTESAVKLHRFEAGALPATPWKNGGGTTREVLCWPPGAGLDDFDWRVSIATIGASGPFSTFPGVDRVITLLDGDGVHLRSPDGTVDHRLDIALQPFTFPGSLAIGCTVLGGASTDFNVMSRHATGRIEVEILHADHPWTNARAGLLMCVRGIWMCNSELLAEGQGLWWADKTRAWALSPCSDDAVLIAVRRTPA